MAFDAGKLPLDRMPVERLVDILPTRSPLAGSFYTSPPVHTGPGDPYDLDYVAVPELFIRISGTGVTDSNYYRGTAGADSIISVPTSGHQEVYAAAGDDYIEANGRGYVYAGSGDDTVLGHDGSSSDLEIIFGGSGADNIQGRGGFNQIVGGYGADTLTGGPDVDYFVYYDARDTGDVITNFESGEDKIGLRTPDWESLVFQGLLGSPGAVSAGGYGYYPRQSGGITVYVDIDGVAGADLEIHLPNINLVSASDFHII